MIIERREGGETIVASPAGHSETLHQGGIDIIKTGYIQSTVGREAYLTLNGVASEKQVIRLTSHGIKFSCVLRFSCTLSDGLVAPLFCFHRW